MMCTFLFHKNIILIVLLVCCVQRMRSEVTKCCSNHHVLDMQKFSCELLINQTNWDVYNIQSSSLLPNCAKPNYVFKERESYIELNGCIDKNKNDKYVAITCSKDSLIGVHLMNKCCSFGQSYDHSERFCAPNSDVHGHFKKLFGNVAVIFENKIPDCSEDEVFVEYFSTEHNIHFDGKNLNVNDNTLMSDKFCIEDLVNINSSETKNNDKYFIVRSCHPRSICEKIPCIRRCCKADQVMFPQPKGKRECQYHPNKKNLHPTFYDIGLSLNNNPKEVHIKGRNLCFMFSTAVEFCARLP